MIHLSNVLLIHISGRIGDSLLATPSITTFQKNFLNARIDLLVHRNRLDLFKNVPNVNLIGSISEKRAWYKGWLSLQKYDYVIIFNYGNELRNIIKSENESYKDIYNIINSVISSLTDSTRFEGSSSRLRKIATNLIFNFNLN